MAGDETRHEALVRKLQRLAAGEAREGKCELAGDGGGVGAIACDGGHEVFEKRIILAADDGKIAGDFDVKAGKHGIRGREGQGLRDEESGGAISQAREAPEPRFNLGDAAVVLQH